MFCFAIIFIFFPSETVGLLALGYLIVRTPIGERTDLYRSLSGPKKWAKDRHCLDIGHRGMGDSHTKEDE